MSEAGGARPRRLYLDVAAAYDRWAALYDSYDNPMVFMARSALHAAFYDVAGQTVVEFGCGTGRNLELLRTRGAGRLIGLDLSEGMLAEARALGAADVLIRHDMTRPAPLESSSADRVFFCLSLEHVAALVLPIAEAARVLRPGGRIDIVEIHPFLALGGTQAHFRDGGEEVHMPAVPHRFADYLRAFRETGLTLTDCREWRPRDVAGEVPSKALKRGAETPIVVSFALRKD